MKLKRAIFSFLVIPIILMFFCLTLYTGRNIDSAVTILSNGNWDFGYVSKDTTSYYSSLVGYTGQAFTDKLSDVISAGATRTTYGGGSGQTGDKLRYTDESPRDSSKVVLLYSGHDLEKSKLNQSSSWTWNQEHTWAKSHGFPDAKSNNAYCDLHHLRPTYEKINSTRSNLDFGEVVNYGGTVKTDELYGSKVISGVIFEPRDAVKGDVARIMMYMDVRYAGKKSNDPVLTLNNKTQTAGSAVGSGEFGNLQTLLKWHNQDPVDDLEKRRNDRIQEIQGNRNPFIDHPEFIEEVYNTPYTGEGGGGVIVPPDPATDQEKADNVISAINNIGTVTLSSKNLIDSAKSLYYSLTANQKALVTNYAVLTNAIADYEFLVSQQTSTSAYEGNFNNITASNSSYKNDITGDVEGKSWTISHGYKANNDVRLGNNKGSISVPEKFKALVSPTLGASLEMNWDIQNAVKISFKFGTYFDTVSGMYIVASYDGGATYSIAASTTSKPSEFSATISANGNTRFALIIVGSTPRVTLNTVKIEVGEEVVNPKISQLIEKINDIGELVLNENTYELLNEIETSYNLLNASEKLLITNYNDFVAKKDIFNNLVDAEVLKVDNEIEGLYNVYFANIFDDQVQELIDDLINKYYDELLPVVISKINNVDKFDELVRYSDEVFEFIIYIEEIGNPPYFEESLIEFVSFYNNTFIKNHIDSHDYYAEVVQNIINHVSSTTLFQSLVTNSSIMFTYNKNTNELIEGTMAIRFGAFMDKELYDELLKLDSNIEFGVEMNGKHMKLTPAQVDHQGAQVSSSQGNYYQFAAVLANISLDHINTQLTAKAYVKIDGEYYYMQSVAKSFIDVAQAYLFSSSEKFAEHLDVLNHIVAMKEQ